MTKQFTIPCQFGQQTSPVTFYIGHPDNGHHPIHFQSNWLSSSKGGTVPQDLMMTLQKLHDLALENNADFEELCYYALISATQNSGGDGVSEGEITSYADEYIKKELGENAIADGQNGDALNKNDSEKNVIATENADGGSDEKVNDNNVDTVKADHLQMENVLDDANNNDGRSIAADEEGKVRAKVMPSLNTNTQKTEVNAETHNAADESLLDTDLFNDGFADNSIQQNEILQNDIESANNDDTDNELMDDELLLDDDIMFDDDKNDVENNENTTRDGDHEGSFDENEYDDLLDGDILFDDVLNDEESKMHDGGETTDNFSTDNDESNDGDGNDTGGEDDLAMDDDLMDFGK